MIDSSAAILKKTGGVAASLGFEPSGKPNGLKTLFQNSASLGG